MLAICNKQTKNLFVVFGLAGSLSTTLITGMLYSEGDRRGIKQLFLSHMKTSTLTSAVIGVFLFFLAKPIYGIVVSGQTLDYITTITKLSACVLPFISIKWFYQSYLQATKHKKEGLILSIFSEYIFCAVPALILSHFFGINGVWWAFFFLDFLPTPAVGLMILHHVRKQKMENPRNVAEESTDILDKVLFLPINFIGKTDRIIDITIQNKKDYEKLLERMYDFCISHKLTEKESYHLSLAVEELVGNILEYGFKNPKNRIDLRVVVGESGQHSLIRIRDNCFAFNPKEKYEMHSAKDNPAENIGIRIVTKLASRIEYINALKLNCLVIELPRM